MANEAKDSMRRRYKLRKNCASKLTGTSMLDYARNQLGGTRGSREEVKGNTMTATA